LASSSDRLPLTVFLVSIGEGVLTNFVRTGDEGADLELYRFSQKLVRSDTGSRLPERLCLGGSADTGRLVPYMEGGVVAGEVEEWKIGEVEEGKTASP
jgi:hypothetical protein